MHSDLPISTEDLFGAALDAGDVLRLLKDPASPPDLLRDVVMGFLRFDPPALGKLRWGAQALQELPLALFSQPSLWTPPVSDALLRYALPDLAYVFKDGPGVESVVSGASVVRFHTHAIISPEVAELALALLPEMPLKFRVPVSHALLRLAATSATTVPSERLDASILRTLDEMHEAVRTGHVVADTLLPEVLMHGPESLHPLLIERALEWGMVWSDDCGDVLARTSCLTPALLFRLLSLHAEGVDSALLRNERLPSEARLTLCERYASGQRELPVRVDPSSLLALDAAAGLPPAYLAHVARGSWEAGVAVPWEMAQALLRLPRLPAGLAALAFSVQGEDFVAACVRSKKDGAAKEIARCWIENPVDGPVLAALISYPRASVRRLLIPAGGVFSLAGLPGSARDLLVTRVLPHLAESDASAEIRRIAHDLLSEWNTYLEGSAS